MVADYIEGIHTKICQQKIITFMWNYPKIPQLFLPRQINFLAQGRNICQNNILNYFLKSVIWVSEK